MNKDADPIPSQEDLLGALQQVLQEQIARVKKGDLGGVEALSGQAGELLTALQKKQASEPNLPKERYEPLIKLYQQLELIIAAEKESVRRQLQKVGEGKKTIHAYHKQ